MSDLALRAEDPHGRSHMMRKARLTIFTAAAVLLAAACSTLRPDRAIRIGTAFVSQTLCSAAFVSGLDPDQVYSETLKPMGKMELLDWALRYNVDTTRQEVATSFAGLFRSRAVYREGAGCLIVRGVPAPVPLVGGAALAAVDPLPKVETANEKLGAVLDRVFARPDLATKAVVVIHDGRIIAERYAPGYTTTTAMQGWSVRKSVINALVGILVRQGRLAVEQPAPVASWRNPADPRHEITVDHLLRMTSGLALAETRSGFDPVSRMLFLERDMAAFAERARLEAKPGSRWQYSTGNSVILSRIIRDAVGGAPGDVVRFARRELFEPLGMSTVILEFDAAGTPTSMYASARDWARFGMLFANGGIHDGQQILPEGWIPYSTSPTRNRDYGAGWWLGGPRWRRDWALPDDAFYAGGLLHQKLLVVPSARLVIARFGVTHVDDDGFGWLAENVLSTLE